MAEEPSNPTLAATPLPEGRTRLGRYRVVRLLGRGAMGVVYEGKAEDGARVAAAANGEVEFFNARTGAREGLRISSGGQIWRVLYAPGGRRLITLGPTPRVWDVETAHLVKELRPPDDFLETRLALTPDGRTLITGGYRQRRLRILSVAPWCAADADPL